MLPYRGVGGDAVLTEVDKDVPEMVRNIARLRIEN